MAIVKLYKSHVMHFVTALTVSEILTFQICDLEKLGQSHELQNSQRAHSMANSQQL